MIRAEVVEINIARMDAQVVVKPVALNLGQWCFEFLMDVLQRQKSAIVRFVNASTPLGATLLYICVSLPNS